ncbi:hypothetical protein PUR50_29375, partial [Enterobacter hormaechei subsp. steigerwaltii]|nr:hypothetical protein [Enterobacter hormaechei subsp. steigerwaltii]
MEHGARLSTSRVMAIAFIFMSVLIVLSLSVNLILKTVVIHPLNEVNRDRKS